MSKRKHIAIVCGGYSGEFEVSLRSAQGILSWMDRTLFEPYIVRIDQSAWSVCLEDGNTLPIDRATFSFGAGEQKIQFDYAYITIHGTPGENGILQGYFDMIGIPYNTGGVLTESLTFNKYFCNHYLSTFPNVRVARSLRLKAEGAVRSAESTGITPQEILREVGGLPLFVKPNTGGSSVATTRVDREEELFPAIDIAFAESDEVMIEQLIRGVEVTCGCYQRGKEIIALPITEVVTANKFFDFDAKYNGQVEEITPARIPEQIYQDIQSLTKQIYGYVDASGVIRVDYIIEEDGKPTLLEVNTTPGMTPTSFIPQQVTYAGLKMQDFITLLISQRLDLNA